MFGFSITKILFTLAAIVAIWYGFKWFNRMQDNRDAPRGRVRGSARPQKRSAPRQPRETAADSDGVEDMIACPTCGDFVTARGARSCGRGDCPYPG